MARFKNQHLQGLIGPVSCCTWKNKQYLRSRPGKSNRPPTAAQLAHREKFTVVGKFVKKFDTIHPLCFAEFEPDNVPRNMAFKANFHFAAQGEYPNISIDYTRAVLSQGRLPNVESPAVRYENGALHFTWQGLTRTNKATGADKVILIAYSPGIDEAAYTSEAAKRSDGQGILSVTGLHGEVHVWISCVRVDKTRVANSIYLGAIAVQP